MAKKKGHSYNYVASSKTRKVHVPHCEYGSTLIGSANFVGFDTLKEAYAEEYEACRICHPER